MRCSANGNQAAATTSTDDTILTVVSATTIRPHVYYIALGCPAAPADQAVLVNVKRITADGTGSAITIAKQDLADGTVKTTAKSNHTAQPTYTANTIMLAIPLNQQATFQWQTVPEEGLVLPATANAGFGMQYSSTTGSAVFEGLAMWEE